MKGKLREGYTTGSCAAAAALGSVLWQLQGECPCRVEIVTPSGKHLILKTEPLSGYTCGVIKDAGDDPDVTDGCMVTARVQIEGKAADGIPAEESGQNIAEGSGQNAADRSGQKAVEESGQNIGEGTGQKTADSSGQNLIEGIGQNSPGRITFRAGEGVGTVTLPGLKLAVGEPAINPVPRQMIADAINPWLDGRSACVTVGIPGGQELAKKTFNGKLGIEGGLSILGTSGIVRPMSDEAVRETLSLEMQVRLLKEHPGGLVFVPGADGERVVKSLWQDVCCVQVSNYIGYMLDEAARMEVRYILVAGFSGKLVKLAANIMNTHSHVADGRRETLCTFAALAGADSAVIHEIYDCVTVTAAEEVIHRGGYDGIWQTAADAAAKNCTDRVHGEIEVAVMMFGKDRKILCQSANMEKVLAGMRL